MVAASMSIPLVRSPSPARKLFEAGFINVQSRSGAQANLAVFPALVKPSDRIIGLDLAHGGQPSHGSRIIMSGQWFDAVSYDVSENDRLIDMVRLRVQAFETSRNPSSRAPRPVRAISLAGPHTMDPARDAG